MLLADDLFLIAHADPAGKSQLPARQTGLCLAGAMLADLVLADRVDVHGATLRVRDPRPIADELNAFVLRQIVSEAEHTAVGTWLAFIGQEAVEWVGRRAALSGLVRRQEVRRMWVTSVRYPALDPDQAGRTTIRLQQAVWRTEPLPMYDMVLAALIAATGLSRAVWFDSDPASSRYLAGLRSALPRPLFDLVAHTEAAIANAVITRHA